MWSKSSGRRTLFTSSYIAFGPQKIAGGCQLLWRNGLLYVRYSKVIRYTDNSIGFNSTSVMSKGSMVHIYIYIHLCAVMCIYMNYIHMHDQTGIKYSVYAEHVLFRSYTVLLKSGIPGKSCCVL